MEWWQGLSLYLVAAVLVTFLYALFFGESDGNEAPASIVGLFWPFVLIFGAFAALTFAFLILPARIGNRFHKETATPPETHNGQ